MPELDFVSLQNRLVQQGVAARYARRLAGELAEHYEDLRDEAIGTGFLPDEAACFAEEQLGSADEILSAVFHRPELRSWIYRYPRVARIALPVAFVALLPAVPVFAGMNHADSLLRWTCCAMLSALFTALLMLCLQLSIALA
ncbi:MAG TPA: hypothetical protein VKZ91_14190 [Woeseiaceae bacterium]|nr:hypothetical protein [Woeseiaceae bacterium]